MSPTPPWTLEVNFSDATQDLRGGAAHDAFSANPAWELTRAESSGFICVCAGMAMGSTPFLTLYLSVFMPFGLKEESPRSEHWRHAYSVCGFGLTLGASMRHTLHATTQRVVHLDAHVNVPSACVSEFSGCV